MSVLPVEPAYRLAERADEHRWLVTGLWSEQAVGIVGGEPKCGKSFLALDLAVSVASGTPCLRRFVVPKAGRVLLYAAEDALHIVRRRLDGIAVAAGMMLADLDIQVITAPVLRLDLEVDRRNLHRPLPADARQSQEMANLTAQQRRLLEQEAQQRRIDIENADRANREYEQRRHTESEGESE